MGITHMETIRDAIIIKRLGKRTGFAFCGAENHVMIRWL
jgi:hypothetical protein